MFAGPRGLPGFVREQREDIGICDRLPSRDDLYGGTRMR